TIVVLVEIEAGLLAVQDIDTVGQPVFRYGQRIGQFTVHDLGTRRQVFQRAHVGVGALDDGTRLQHIAQDSNEDFAPAFDAGGETLHDQNVFVAIDDETGQSVRFTMHQAQRARAGVEQLAPPRQRRRDAAAKKIIVYGRAGIERPYTGTYLRSRAERRARQKCAVGRND